MTWQTLDGTWSAQDPAVWIERTIAADGSRAVSMLRHPDRPFAGTADAGSLDADLREAATRYAEAIAGAAGIGAAVVRALRDDTADVGWLDLAWGSAALAPGRAADPGKSFWVARSVDGGSEVDRTAVVLAARRTADGTAAGDEVGLRVVMHIVQMPGTRKKRWLVRITGASMSNLPGSVAARKAAGAGSRPAAASMPASYGFGTADAPPSGAPAVDRLLSDAVFLRDPASSGLPRTLAQRRPTAPEANFTASKADLALPLQPGGMGAKGGAPSRRLAIPGYLEVRQTRVGNAEGDPCRVYSLASDRPAVRSDDFAALSAYARGMELFDRLLAYGLQPRHYFKLARLPLIVRHRAPLPGAGDANTVNAAVRLERADGTAPAPAQAEPAGAHGDCRPWLSMRFGAANLSHRALRPNDAGRLRAQPLGLAADPRWAWHEAGHVLNFASFGALEFRFAHSAGDALAAIASDPGSQLATAGDRLRFQTFPWVRLPRRHDREAARGWCWCGRRNRVRLANAPGWTDRRLGYFGEQLMSSSLFRLYRAIGGDTFGDDRMRRGASDYTLYLIMRAIALLGPYSVVAARTADQFVSALIDADAGTGAWRVQPGLARAGGDARFAPGRERTGGRLHKVIRWAFERQGLYATDDPGAAREGPGEAPPVDIYIADRRLQHGDGASLAADGGYHPVPLAWGTGSAMPWHAGDAAIRHDDGEVVVTVRNRGAREAQGVRVAVRVSPVARLSAPAGKRSWTALAACDDKDGCAVPAAGEVAFRFGATPGEKGHALQGDHFVWAEATCAADRSIHADPAAWRRDAAGGVPTGPAAPPIGDDALLDLIANDNNQGLRIVSFA